MTDTLMTLGQISPPATTITPIYTAPTGSVVSSIIVCNTSTSPATFRISLAIGGAADNIRQYLFYDLIIPENDTFVASMGISMAAGDVLNVYASTTNIAFNISGVQIS